MEVGAKTLAGDCVSVRREGEKHTLPYSITKNAAVSVGRTISQLRSRVIMIPTTL